MKFVWEPEFNRYAITIDGAHAGWVYGKTGLWRSYNRPNGIVREGRTRAIAAERMLLATGQLRRSA
ncbi:MAG TPA: hypothetical protein PLL30_16980 [Candidatus Krumholzibacteria bacterium]|nr:hypothetical protein [Candidatus Krumholzibacteria bacterium]HPD73469.1 hypothetical protein [Candidatus Krumholzibacteria bacterium]HRY42192.1 hypothetical protein [Candidatus Krumholzibacteria bacterium]